MREPPLFSNIISCSRMLGGSGGCHSHGGCCCDYCGCLAPNIHGLAPMSTAQTTMSLAAATALAINNSCERALLPLGRCFVRVCVLAQHGLFGQNDRLTPSAHMQHIVGHAAASVSDAGLGAHWLAVANLLCMLDVLNFQVCCGYR